MKITCDVIQDLMPSYIDGILSEDSKALVEEHMGTCQECRKMLEIMKEEQGKEQNQMRSSAATLKKNPEKADSTQSSDSNRGSYPDTHRCGSRLQPLVFQRKIYDPGGQWNVCKK